MKETQRVREAKDDGRLTDEWERQMESCGNCRFRGSINMCLRFPPGPGNGTDDERLPKVDDDHWCGEWEPLQRVREAERWADRILNATAEGSTLELNERIDETFVQGSPLHARVYAGPDRTRVQAVLRYRGWRQTTEATADNDFKEIWTLKR